MSDNFDEVIEMYDSPSPSNPPFNMEKEMRNLMRLLEGQDFESDEERDVFLANALNNSDMIPSEQPRDLAQDLLFEARETGGDKRKQLIEQALSIYPNSPDAYTLLAEDAQDFDERMTYSQKAVDVGEEDLGQAFFSENKGHF